MSSQVQQVLTATMAMVSAASANPSDAGASRFMVAILEGEPSGVSRRDGPARFRAGRTMAVHWAGTENIETARPCALSP
jgi:hypothetical protein